VLAAAAVLLTGVTLWFAVALGISLARDGGLLS
jgi:hypothetical protein